MYYVIRSKLDAMAPTPPADAGSAPREVARVLRDLSWTIHRRIPETRGFHALPTTELAILKHVLDDPGVTVTELSRRLGMQPSNTSAAVKALTTKGMLERRPGPDDKRVVMLFVTAAAMKEHDAIATAWQGSIDRALAQLPPEQLAALEAATEALSALDEIAQRQLSRG